MNRRKEIQVGLTVIVSMAVLIWGVLWFKQALTSATMIHYEVAFDSVGGLKAGDRVQVQGIRMGSVEAFEILGGDVVVRFKVDEKASLRQDAAVSLASQGIVGEMLVEIMPGTGEVARDGHRFQGRVMKDMNAMMDEGAATLAEARALTKEITAFMETIRGEGRLQSMLDNTAAATQTLMESTEEIAPDVRSLVAELRATNEAVRGAVAGEDSLLAGTLTDARESMAAVQELTDLLTRTTVTLADVVTRLENGEGTVGRALRDESLYAAAESTIVDVQELIADIKARPKRYFHVSLF
ncbi:MAG TPA: MlaD family protein [Candidatus Krumholzibacteria bacterium]|nr:MlaD family protein [Candidatus Krumholzibacteria bacterium]HRX50814.1 MlaD family protein [Candidatus Krumholzibacteria bacterium]